MHSFKHRSAVESGFSLVEVILSLGILALIGLAVFSFQKNVLSLNRLISGNLTSQAEARRALKDMSAEIRSASPSSLGAYALAQTSTSTLTFYSNIDADASVERVRYFIQGTTLKKGILKPSGTPLAYNPANETVRESIHNIGNGTTTLFSYHDTNYDGTSPPLAEPINISVVRLVKITVLIERSTGTPQSPLTLTTQVSMRNLKDNL
ncbi:MAG: hypothetical protein A2849_03650 [Candidatus Taylorbacteria bacterium RIFCSPHIGHO2_01_FULL_51_15]|uniref:Type II secretion system protein J n=1 Tax=Candidatus Taylorbacteria bacterium RIFCSPHIGHO2_01_FULL_51_15 TaxID=1802304 RepID=A0A1G2MCQ1_9BACT|nr:MAG: hypothetical protein A2849_03650 [Candidatus Taylorbacteria bacterium RIFCSPHIGHO2_01_FULL_51_15]